MKHSRILASAMAAFCITLSPAAQSQDFRFTDQNVRQFIEQRHQSNQGSYADFITDIKKSLHKDYQGHTDVEIYEGYGAAEDHSSSLRKDIIVLITTLDIIERNFKYGQDARKTQNVLAVEIARDGKWAQVKYEGTALNYKSEIDNEGTVKLTDASYECKDALVLNKENLPQVISSYCTVKITYKPGQDT